MSNEAIQKLSGLGMQGPGQGIQDSGDDASSSDVKSLKDRIKSLKGQNVHNPLAEQEMQLAKLVEALESILGVKAPQGLKNKEKIDWLKNELSQKSSVEKADILLRLDMDVASSVGIGKLIKDGIKKETLIDIKKDIANGEVDSSKMDAIKSRIGFLELDVQDKKLLETPKANGNQRDLPGLRKRKILA